MKKEREWIINQRKNAFDDDEDVYDDVYADDARKPRVRWSTKSDGSTAEGGIERWRVFL